MTKKTQTIAEVAEQIKQAYLHGYTCEPGLAAAIACGKTLGVSIEDYIYHGKTGTLFTLLVCKMRAGTDFVVDPEGGVI